MSLKKDLAKEIRELEDEIKELEVKRSRSQAEIIKSLVGKVEPDETEWQYFCQYTAAIDLKREKLTEITQQLKNLV